MVPSTKSGSPKGICYPANLGLVVCLWSDNNIMCITITLMPVNCIDLEVLKKSFQYVQLFGLYQGHLNSI